MYFPVIASSMKDVSRLHVHGLHGAHLSPRHPPQAATLRPRSAVEQRQRLSLANPICSGGIVIFRGSTS